jgi:hypothetical protein
MVPAGGEFITPVLPRATGGCISIVVTFGFHYPQVLVSVQLRQTRSAGAIVSRDLPCSATRKFNLLVGAAG